MKKKQPSNHGVQIGRTYSGQFDEKCRVETLTVEKVENGRVVGFDLDTNKKFDYSISDFKYLMSI